MLKYVLYIILKTNNDSAWCWLDFFVNPDRVDSLTNDVIGFPGWKLKPACHNLAPLTEVGLKFLL